MKCKFCGATVYGRKCGHCGYIAPEDEQNSENMPEIEPMHKLARPDFHVEVLDPSDKNDGEKKINLETVGQDKNNFPVGLPNKTAESKPTWGKLLLDIFFKYLLELALAAIIPFVGFVIFVGYVIASIRTGKDNYAKLAFAVFAVTVVRLMFLML